MAVRSSLTHEHSPLWWNLICIFIDAVIVQKLPTQSIFEVFCVGNSLW